MYQTDFKGFIEKDGCLCFDLFKIAEKKSRQGLTKLQIADLVHMLHHNVFCSYNNQIPVLSDEYDINKPGIFVWDHPAVANKAMEVMNITDWKLQYIGRLYTKAEEARGKISFGTHLGADEMIFQLQTIISGHFRMLDYDSWKPGTIAKYVKSIRYYKWVRGKK